MLDTPSPTPSDHLTGRRVAFLLAGDGAEQTHFTQLWMAVVEAGGTPVLVAPSPGSVTTTGRDAQGNDFEVDEPLSEADGRAFDALVLAGGVVAADTLRTSDRARALVRELVEEGRPVAAVGHAAWLLADAGVARGRQVTSWPSIAPDLTGAGARWRDEPVVVDGPLLTARHAGDLQRLGAALVHAIASGAAAPVR